MNENEILEEMVEYMHNANVNSDINKQRIPQSAFTEDYRKYLLRQAASALTVARKYKEFL